VDIPVKNLFWILAYSGDVLETAKSIEASIDDETDLLNLYARVLSEAIEGIGRSGFERNYQTMEEEGRILKGKIDLRSSLNRLLIEQGKIKCAYDELTNDILPNQILKTSLQLLLGHPSVSKSNNQALTRVDKLFSEVKRLELDDRHFEFLPRSFGNRIYPFAMMICRMIWSSVQPVDRPGQHLFKDFYRDPIKMRKVFESFVRNFFRLSQTDFKVKSEKFDWQLIEETEGSQAHLPMLLTDTCLISISRKIVIETKFVAGPLVKGRAENTTFDSSHLYQLTAYLNNLRDRDGHSSEGILLYPSIGVEHKHVFRSKEHKITIATINLAKDRFEDIRKDLLDLIAA
jgi:5-methylcytosine-specific restriction enzyme subunit McrC